MKVLEFTLLIICYSSLLIALFLEVLCYSRKMETKETIAFTLSLLLLIVSLSISPIVESKWNVSVSILIKLISMTLVSMTTLLNVLNERINTFPKTARTFHFFFGVALIGSSIVCFFLDYLSYIEAVVPVYLILSIVLSMMIVFLTKPKKQFAHLEKVEKRFALSLIILVPIVIVFGFWMEEQYNQLQIGFMIPVIFILLALNKIQDDLKRLSIIQTGLEPKQQKFKNYNLTKREEEIATLLFEGLTYRSISEQLFISLPTVKTHASNVYKKCGVKTRHELVSVLMN